MAGMVPLPTQISGAQFLASRKRALLADEPRVGKTGAALLAADYVFARSVLIVTTASGRPVWRRAVRDWSAYDRSVAVLTTQEHRAKPDVAIVSWAGAADARIRVHLASRSWDVVILDESHYAKSFDAKRTQAVYGVSREDGRWLATGASLARGGHVWCLSGTPAPNALNDLYPMLRALAPEKLAPDPKRGWPDVTLYEAFLKRYCKVKPKKVGNFRWIRVVVGSQNEAELRDRIGDFMLRRTQQDVGIRPPVIELLPLSVSDDAREEIDLQVDARAVLAAIDANETAALEMHLGPLRRLTGAIKAKAVVEAVREEFESGLDKIVLMAWHSDVIAALVDGLTDYGVVTLDGSSTAVERERAEHLFQTDPGIRVFVGQILAAGEAIDLSAAASLLFVEASFVPKDMKQASLRVTNHSQTRQCFVRVAVLENSIDEALQTVLLRKWAAIREVIQ